VSQWRSQTNIKEEATLLGERGALARNGGLGAESPAGSRGETLLDL